MPERAVTQVGGRRLTVSHLDKPLWPEFSKAQLLDYYLRVSEFLLPHLRDRAASFLRTPDGPTGPRFFTHSAPPGLPKWIRTVPKGHRDHVAVDDVETLIAVANAYCVEIHVPQWSAGAGPDLHDQIVFDLDPGEGADIATCCEVALLLRELLAANDFVSFPATTGGVGLHIYIALDPPWLVDDALTYAKSLAQSLSADHRHLITHIRGPKARAGGKVLVDWAQNHSRATTSVPYTLRAREAAPSVSTPLTWREVERADPAQLDFSPAEVLERIERLGDLTRRSEETRG